jgi:hypothetical protein
MMKAGEQAKVYRELDHLEKVPMQKTEKTRR